MMSVDQSVTYPEHEKLAAVADESQAIGAFLDSDQHPYVLSEWVTIEGYSEPRLMPVQKSIQQILAEYFDIDLQKIEAEKRQMLTAMAAAHED